MADKVAEALNRANLCTLHSGCVDNDALFQFAADFFYTDDGVVSDDDDDDCDEEENDVLEQLDLSAAPDYASVIQELENTEELLAADDINESNDINATCSNVSDEEDGPTVVVDQARPILDSVTDLFVSASEKDEKAKIANFDCKCKLSETGQCYKQFSNEYVHRLRMDMNALTPKEKDMFIMGKISCHIHLSKDTECSKRKTQKERKRYRTTFMIENKVICRDTFRFMHW